MMEERKTEEFETNVKKWQIYFDRGDKFEDRHSCIDVRFAKSEYPLTSQDIEELKQDLKDLGKFRIIKQGKDFLEK
jgi:hypothetical protein